MNQLNKNKHHYVLGITLTVLVLLTGVMLISSCLDIYYSREQDPYSPATVAQAFHKISTIVWITVIAIAIGMLVDFLSPNAKKPPKAIVFQEITLRKLHSKLSAGSSSAKSRLKEFRRQRILFAVTPWIISMGLMIYPFIYFSNFEHFTVAELNNDIIKAVLIVMVPAILALICFLIAGILIKRTLQKEIAFCKQLLKEAPMGNAPSTDPHPSDKKWFFLGIRFGILLLAAVFIAVGISNGGAQDVLKKAIAICTECIGLG